jgi:hypothetical protein
MVFKKTASFCRKLAKIAENCDHNIDPWKDSVLKTNGRKFPPTLYLGPINRELLIPALVRSMRK